MAYLPCVGCGWCCLTDQCMDSMRRHGYQRRCPELKWAENRHRYICLAMLDKDWADEIRFNQHAGQGCCAPLNPWRNEIKNRD